MLSKDTTNLGLNSTRQFVNSKKQKYVSIITPSTTTHGSNFFNRGNTSPTKEKEEEGTSSAPTSDKTVTKNYFNSFLSCGIVNRSNDLKQDLFPIKENDFFSPNLNNQAMRFTSNNFRSQVKNLVLETEKPSLNTTESRNKLIEFSKTKKYLEDEKNNTEIFLEHESKRINFFKENNEVIKETDEENEKQQDEIKILTPEEAYHQRLLNIKNNLPVPEEKKDDEKFKILKMKEMRKTSLPAFKSAKMTDVYNPNTPQANFENGKK